MEYNEKSLHQAIREKGLQYKVVASLSGCAVERVCQDVSRRRLSAERAYVYGRALGIDPCEFRPDVFRSGEVKFGT